MSSWGIIHSSRAWQSWIAWGGPIALLVRLVFGIQWPFGLELPLTNSLRWPGEPPVRCRAGRWPARAIALCAVTLSTTPQKNFSPATPAKPRLPAGLRVKGASVKIQGFKSWTSRKPRRKTRFDGELQRRYAERRTRGTSLQEPPRTTARTSEPQPLVRALPSMGAPA